MVEKLIYTMPTVFKLADIEKACFGRDAWSIPSLRGEFENSYSHMFGWYEDDKLVGYMCVRVMYEEAQICNIAVLENYRRRGIATALLAETERFVAEQGCLRAELEVNTANIPAVELYKKCGYEVAGVRKNFYRKSRFATGDAYTMVKGLTDNGVADGDGNDGATKQE